MSLECLECEFMTSDRSRMTLGGVCRSVMHVGVSGQHGGMGGVR